MIYRTHMVTGLFLPSLLEQYVDSFVNSIMQQRLLGHQASCFVTLMITLALSCYCPLSFPYIQALKGMIYWLVLPSLGCDIYMLLILYLHSCGVSVFISIILITYWNCCHGSLLYQMNSLNLWWYSVGISRLNNWLSLYCLMMWTSAYSIYWEQFSKLSVKILIVEFYDNHIFTIILLNGKKGINIAYPVK